MDNGKGKLGMTAHAAMVGRGLTEMVARAAHFSYRFEYMRNGVLLDVWTAENLVTTEGGIDLLNKYFKGSGYTAAWYLGLISGASYTSGPAITDTAANLSGVGNSWAECSATYAPNYTTPASTNRAALTFGTPTGTDPVSLSPSAAVNFVFGGAGTVKGAFIAAGSTRLSTTAPLYSAALFTGGDKTISQAGDELNVTVTAKFDLVYTP